MRLRRHRDRLELDPERREARDAGIHLTGGEALLFGRARRVG